MNFGSRAAGMKVLEAAKDVMTGIGQTWTTTSGGKDGAYAQIEIIRALSSNSDNSAVKTFFAANPNWISVDYHFLGMSGEELVAYIREKQVPCPGCGKSDFTDIRKFNLMFKTHQGVTEDTANEVYLRPETAQGIFVNFPSIQRTTRRKLPFGVCQIGKSFRNEITPGNFIFRIREFEQMELEFFCKPDTDLEWFQYWRNYCHEWLKNLNVKDENLRLRDHEKEELSFYSKATTDFEYLFPFGWGELWGVADRTNYDLTQHQTHSGQDLTYFDQEKNEHYIPFVIEPSLGADRMRTPSRNFWTDNTFTSSTCPARRTWVPQQAQQSASGKVMMRTAPVSSFLLR